MYLFIGYSNQPTSVGFFYDKTCFLTGIPDPHPHLHILGQNLSTVRLTSGVIPVGCFLCNSVLNEKLPCRIKHTE